MDSQALSLYLAIMIGREELVARGLGEVTHTKKRGEGGRGRKIGITTAEVTQETVPEERKLFFPPTRRPTALEEREMLALALEVAIKVAMGNHIYAFNGTVRLQLEGGPIGNSLSGALAKVYMLWWCRTFLNLLNQATNSIVGFALFMLLFYVDDVNLALEELAPGSRFIDGKVEVVPEEVEGDLRLPGDQRTALVIQSIANSICPSIQMEIDYPSRHEHGWMPLLNLQVRDKDDNSIDYKWYGKKVSNPLLMMSSSALSEKVKTNSLVQMAITRLSNTRRTLPWKVSADILTGFSLRMKWSGYSAAFRKEVIYAAVTGYERILEKVDKGERPLHRPRTWNTEARQKKKLISKGAWYRPADAVFFAPATPGGELAKQLQEVMVEEGKRLNLIIKTVETGGISLKRKLTGKDLSAGEPCGQPGCLFCLSEEGGGSHSKANCTYKGSCKYCAQMGLEASYYGESAFSGYYRTESGHSKAIEKKDLNNAFAKHLNIFHPEAEGNKEAFNMKILQTFTKPLERKVSEAVLINNSKAAIKMNSKAEFHQPAVARVITTREPPGQGPDHVDGAEGR